MYYVIILNKCNKYFSMTNISNEVIPYAIYFIVLIFYLASLQKKKQKSKKVFNMNNLQNDDKKIITFLDDSEKKLLALRDLYKQELIDLELYMKKSDQIANIVSKVLGNNILEYGTLKNNQIISEIKNGIETKLKNNQLNIKDNDVDLNFNLDSILVSIEDKIKSNETKVR